MPRSEGTEQQKEEEGSTRPVRKPRSRVLAARCKAHNAPAQSRRPGLRALSFLSRKETHNPALHWKPPLFTLTLTVCDKNKDDVFSFSPNLCFSLVIVFFSLSHFYCTLCLPRHYTLFGSRSHDCLLLCHPNEAIWMMRNITLHATGVLNAYYMNYFTEMNILILSN